MNADEAFLTNEQMNALCQARWGVDAPLLASVLDQWPEGLPTDFEHQLMRDMGLKCGNDEAREHYAMLQERHPSGVLGWRIWKVSDLVERTTASLAEARATTHASRWGY